MGDMTSRIAGGARRFGPLLLPTVLLALAACHPNDPQNTFTANGYVAQRLADLFWVTFWWAVVVFILVQGLLLVAMIKFRRRSDAEVPTQVHGNTRFEIGWTILPTLILVAVGVPGVQTLFELEDPPSPPLTVEVVGHQWWWEFRYHTDWPDANENTTGRQYGIQNVVTATDLHIPINVPVKVYLRSADTQHSFWVPRLAGKTDLIPPRVNHMWFNATDPGTYSAQCAELCGVQHAQMRFYVMAQPEAEFRTWVQQQQAAPAQPTGGAPQRGQEMLITGGCLACHTIQGTIAQGVIGPNLTHVASRSSLAGGILENTPENLARWLHDPQAVKYGNNMKLPRPLTDDEVSDLVAYLETLR
jgi:cytochrome c oxidase subunit 2